MLDTKLINYVNPRLKFHPAKYNQSNFMGNLKMDWSERG
ncbi:hypothetical protein BH18THE1_BH18THE1_02170 [soil metagenome]